MKIYISEITSEDTKLDFTEKEKWVSDAILKADEFMEDASGDAGLGKSSLSNSKGQKPRPAQVHLCLRKVDEVVVLTGKLDTHIRLLCSRCAISFEHPCHTKLSALFCKDPVMAGVAHLQPTSHSKDQMKPVGQNKGFARHAHNFNEDAAVEGGEDLDITYLSGDQIDLGDVLTEQLQLQVPFQPLCKEDCKGICSNCGADLNHGRCACAKILENSAFAALKSIKFQ